MRKNFLSEAMKEESRPCCKAFEQTQAFPPVEHVLVFLWWEILLPGSDNELTEKLLACSVPTLMYQ